MAVGKFTLAQQTVTVNGIRNVTVEQYIEGFVAFLLIEGNRYTNNVAYKTGRTAINAAAKWEIN